MMVGVSAPSGSRLAMRPAKSFWKKGQLWRTTCQWLCQRIRLVTPGTTAHADTASHHLFANGFLLDATTIEWFFEQYIERSQRSDWRFAPLNADDLEGVAPACVVLAECDPLTDEGIAYADRLRAAHVPVDLEIYRGVVHGFINLGRAIPEALTAHADAARALRHAFAAHRAP